LEVLPRKLSDWRDQCPPLCRQLASIKDWFVTQDSFVHLLSADTAATPGEAVDLFVNSVLVSVQALLAQSPEQHKGEDSEEDGPYISKGVKGTATFTHLLNLAGVSRSLHALLRTGSSDPEALKVIGSILPFLDLYLSVVDAQLKNHASWTKAVHKLAFIICSLLKTLSQQGFCRPPDDDGKQCGEDGAPSEGLGIGEGTGEENVSSEIQEESQVEGLKGEEESKEKQERNVDDDAIEMSEDIGGDLEDVEEKEGDEVKSEDEDEAEEEDLDETLDKLDSLDPSTVDEKIWGDEQGKDDGEDKVDQDRSKEEGEGESEMVAKENEKEKGKEKEKDDKDKEQSKEEKPEGEAPEVQDLEDKKEGEQEQDGMEEDAPGPDGAPLDSTVQDADTLDLPEDLNLGEDGMVQEEEQDLDMDMDMEDDEAMPEDGQVEKMDTEEMDDLKDDMSDEGQGDTAAGDAQATDEPTEEEMADSTLPVTAQVDVTQGDGQSDPTQANLPRPGESGSASGGASIGAGEQAQDGEREKTDSQ